MKIGNYNLFEVGTFIESSDIGDYNTFQHRSQVESQSIIKSGCIIGTCVRVASSFTFYYRVTNRKPTRNSLSRQNSRQHQFQRCSAQSQYSLNGLSSAKVTPGPQYSPQNLIYIIQYNKLDEEFGNKNKYILDQNRI